VPVRTGLLQVLANGAIRKTGLKLFIHDLIIGSLIKNPVFKPGTTVNRLKILSSILQKVRLTWITKAKAKVHQHHSG
jgi:hypothetical protein